jgi:hypothetical protein
MPRCTSEQRACQMQPVLLDTVCLQLQAHRCQSAKQTSLASIDTLAFGRPKLYKASPGEYWRNPKPRAAKTLPKATYTTCLGA